MLQNDPWDDHIITSEDLREEKECPICYIEYEKGDNVAKLNCGHIFHKKCIILWFDKNISSPTCPICRTNMNDKQSNEQQLENNPNEIPVINDQDHQSDNENLFAFTNNPNRNQATNNSNKKHSGSCCCILI